METLYSVLEVPQDADAQTVVGAYRDKAKSHHPDVSDCPDAAETFKRLTTAREVLADEAERAKYDRLGHDAYVSQSEDCVGWSTATKSGSGETETKSAAGTPASDSSTAAAAAQACADGGSPTGGPTPRENPTRDGGANSAASYYRPGQRMNPGAAPDPAGGIVARLEAVGPWLLLDSVLLASALATAWLILSWGSLSAFSVLAASLLCVSALAATSVHLSVRAYV